VSSCGHIRRPPVGPLREMDSWKQWTTHLSRRLPSFNRENLMPFFKKRCTYAEFSTRSDIKDKKAMIDDDESKNVWRKKNQQNVWEWFSSTFYHFHKPWLLFIWYYEQFVTTMINNRHAKLSTTKYPISSSLPRNHWKHAPSISTCCL